MAAIWPRAQFPPQLSLFLWLEAISLKSVSLALDSRGCISIWFLFPILSFFYLNPGFHPKWEEEWALPLKTVSTSRQYGYQSPAWWPGTFPKPISSHWWLLAGVWELLSPTWITTHTLTIKQREMASEWCVVWGFWRKCIPRWNQQTNPERQVQPAVHKQWINLPPRKVMPTFGATKP